MSLKYKRSSEIPSDVLCLRLRELAKAVTSGQNSFERELSYRILAEPDRDADLVILEAAGRIEKLEKLIDEKLGIGEGDFKNCYH